MKVFFCSKAFPRAIELLKELLPYEDIFSVAQENVVRPGIETDVVIPMMHRLEPDLIRGTEAKLIHQRGVGLEGVDIAVATPHIAGVTEQNYAGIAGIISENILRVKAGQDPMYCVNETVLKAQKSSNRPMA